MVLLWMKGGRKGGGLVRMEREGRWKRGGGDVLEDGNVRGGSEMLFLSLIPGPIHFEDPPSEYRKQRTGNALEDWAR